MSNIGRGTALRVCMLQCVRLYIKLFALHNNMFIMKVIKSENGVKPVFNN